ncbi:MFS transporter [Phytohalomonas tamaricis]|uniref:MFS transporter n=1 Tax=Phytohalomonas tamaricis TaxID=2081032 RepID=UPI000D0B1274|nr:MFS transporter [Phytohalomonas tamaricis]
MSTKNSIKTYENVLLAVLFVAFGFVFFDRLALSFLFPFIAEELHLSNTQLGMLSSTLALAWAVSGALVGAYSDRTGVRKPLLVCAVILFSVCSALSGLVTGFLSLLLFRAIMGLAEGPILPLSQSLMAEASSPHRRGFNMGLLQGSSAGLFGAIIAPPVLIGLAQMLGWRYAFYATLIPGLIIAFLVWHYVKERPPQEVVSALPQEKECIEPHDKTTSRLQLLKDRNILLCTLISCAFLTWFVILISFTPTYLMAEGHYSADAMGSIMSCIGVGWVLWGFGVPAISDRIGRRPALVTFALVAACCPLALLFVSSPFVLGFFVMTTFTGLGCFSLFMAVIPTETVPRQATVTALGLIMGVGELMGGFVAPSIAGYAADQYSLAIVMWISAGGAVVSALLALLLKETAPNRRPAVQQVDSYPAKSTV